MTGRRWMAAAFGGIVLGAAGAAPATAAEGFDRGKCPVKLAKGVQEGRDVRCGTVGVPLDHADPGGAQIDVAVAVMRSLAARVRRDPVMFLAGGPGEKLLGVLSGLNRPQSLSGVRNRDLILLDQRGVGESRPALECPEVQQVTDAAGFPAAVAACRARVAGVVEPAKFTTAANARDLDVIRRALGYKRVNLYGNSYGTLLALEAMRGDPAWIRSTILSSAVPPQATWIGDAGPNYRRALDALFAACAKDRRCGGTFPGLRAKLEAAIAKLATQPGSVEVEDPASGQPVAVPVTAGLASTILYQLFYSPAGPAALPAFVELLSQGRYAVLAEALGGDAGEPPITLGMQLSVMCAETVSRSDRAQVEAQTATLGTAEQAFIGFNPVIGLPVFDLCATWAVPPLPAAAEPVRSRIPTLVVTGEFDQITPPAYGRLAASTLARSQVVRARAVGHSPLLAIGDCGGRIARAFLTRPRRAAAAACARKPLRFVTPKGGKAAALAPTAPLEAVWPLR